MRQPTEADFDVEVTEAAVNVTFRPSKTHITFNLLADPKDIAKFGPVSPDPLVRHAGPTGDTGDYAQQEVLTMAHQLAAAALTK
jgi:hypothetical protein